MSDDACVMARRLEVLKMDLYMSRGASEHAWYGHECSLDGIPSEAKGSHCLAASGRILIDLSKNKVWSHFGT